MKTPIWGALGVLALATAWGCAKPAPHAASPAVPAAVRIGYVRMDELLHSHPLYAQLEQTERTMDALSLRALGPDAGQTGAELSKEDAELQKELQAASERTKKLLDAKQKEYGEQENAAIAAALQAGGRATGGSPIGNGVAGTARVQAAQVNAAISKDLQAYQDTLSRQDRDQSNALAHSVSDRADREYRAKATELQQRESEFGLELASKDAGQRLQLRTQLANLALDDSQREDVRKKLDALDRSEADQLAAMRNRDEQSLVQLHSDLTDRVKREIQTGVDQIHAQTQAKLNSRAQAAHGAVASKTQVTVPARVTAGNLPPDIKSKIDALHREYQQRFTRDTKGTIDQFNKTRDELKKRYDALHGVDTAAQESLRKEMATLQSQHDKLYAEIIDQINREVKVVALSRGVTTVISDVLGPGEGVDLTSAARKEIESLHE